MQNTLKYLFLDSSIISGHWCENVQLNLCQAHKDTVYSPFFSEAYFSTPSKPWEVRYDNGYPNLSYDEEAKLYRLYYTTFIKDMDSANTPLPDRPHKHYEPSSTRATALCYACSRDGIHWEKPSLGLVEFEGSTDNNILLRGSHGGCVFFDKAEVDSTKRYKLLTKIQFSRDNHFMAVAFSADGIHFCNPIPWPRYNPQADTHNFVFRDSQTNHFVLITRIWKNGLRICARSESEDFIIWSEPVEILRGSGFGSQVYSMPVFEYAGLYMGLPSIYHEGDRQRADFDTVDMGLAYSTDSLVFEQICPQQALVVRGEGHYPDGEFDCGCIYGSTPVEIDGKLYFYYMGGNGQHTDFRETSFGRAWLEPDKFAYYSPVDSSKVGVVMASGFSVYGDELSLLSDLEPGGYLRVEILLKNAQTPLEGFGGAAGCTITENGWQPITFAGRRLTDVGNETIKLKITLYKAKLYAMEGKLCAVKAKYQN